MYTDFGPTPLKQHPKFPQSQRKRIQSNLKDLGYYRSTIDGLYGRGTSGALTAYNKKHLGSADLKKSYNVVTLIRNWSDTTVTISITPKDQDIFSVTLTSSSTTTHTVTIADQMYSKLTDGESSKETLLEKSFEFLLQREPNTSILANFKPEVISQYFPDYAKQASTWK